MRRLISVTHGVTEAHAVQYWYSILDRELRRRVRDATLLSDASPTLPYVFALFEKIELNIVEERAEAGGRSSQARPQSAQVVCDHCGRASHTQDQCFDLHPELTSGGRGRGGDASRGRGGRAGRGGRGAGVVGRPVASATSATESAMVARIEQLEQSLDAMASSGASTSTSYEEEDFPYLASAAQVEASVAVTRGAARALEPRGATRELDPQRGEGGRQARLPQSFLLSESGNGRMSELPVRFISRDRPLGSCHAVLASVASFSGVLTWPDDLLEGNKSADDTPVYEKVEEIVSLAATVSSSLDVLLWSSCHALQLEADRLVKKA
ncbi:hypothetical protein AXG93_2619s1090 [Marchantia polymorpha subsp. ruderalis]|uniref:Uncharacterized protein n=1 Tax=Marchantia polymorpha subsp. ruderalis TaxID=1480154 RepID=A0A176VMV6_MARPO|nr:hypothetical protein AXG93_2619s1090 [Marchantia polymorpha subsp. ruderalis]